MSIKSERPPVELNVFYGHPIEVASEARFLDRLRREMTSAGIRGEIWANFIARTNGGRQIDFFLRTNSATLLMELKSWDTSTPVSGGPNGPWTRHNPHGVDTEIDNPLEQARQAAFALSDLVETLVSRGALKDCGKFYRNFETVVCFDPVIPEGSRIEDAPHQKVVGIPQLLGLLARSGRTPEWNQTDWEALRSNLQLFSEVDGSPEMKDLRFRESRLAAYCAALDEWFERELDPYVAVGALPDVRSTCDLITSGNSIAIIGSSGAGKTHLARHIAVQLSKQGHVVVWLRCGEYRAGEIRTLLRRSLAAFGEGHGLDLLDVASQAGRQICFVFDGANECPAELLGELLEQAGVVARRFGGVVLFTAWSAIQVPALPPLVEIKPRELSSADKALLLEAYGAPDVRGGSFLETPLELKMLAQCGIDLPPTATRTDLMEEYVRRCAPSLTHRSALRALAQLLDDELRSSVSFRQGLSALERGGNRPLPPEVLDEVLANRLIRQERGEIAFQHERFGRFLLSEELVKRAASAAELAEMLAEPRHSDVVSEAIALVPELQQQIDCLSLLASGDLYLRALQGEFGSETARLVWAHAAAAVDTAIAATRNSTIQLDEEKVSGWRAVAKLSKSEVALIEALGANWIGKGEDGGLTRLLDATDETCANHMAALRLVGVTNPISAVLQALVLSNEPVAVVLEAARLHRFAPDTSRVAVNCASGASAQSWTRWMLACNAIRVDELDDRSFFFHLLSSAWTAGGYHVRLEALEAAMRNINSLADEERANLVELLEAFDTNHPFLASLRVEILAACGAIEPIYSAADIIDEIRLVLRDPRKQEAQSLATAIISRQFEPEAIVGPYSEVIFELDEESRLLLAAMAAHIPHWMFRGWTFQQLLEEVNSAGPDTLALMSDAFALAANGPLTDGFAPQDEVHVHVLGIVGYARLHASLPPIPTPTSAWETAWRLVDELIAAEEGVPVDESLVWERVVNEVPGAAIDVFFLWDHCSVDGSERERLRSVTDRHRQEYASVLLRAITNPNEIRSDMRYPRTEERLKFAADELGRTGDPEVAELLETFASDHVFGREVVKAIRQIRERTA